MDRPVRRLALVTGPSMAWFWPHLPSTPNHIPVPQPDRFRPAGQPKPHANHCDICDSPVTITRTKCPCGLATANWLSLSGNRRGKLTHIQTSLAAAPIPCRSFLPLRFENSVFSSVDSHGTARNGYPARERAANQNPLTGVSSRIWARWPGSAGGQTGFEVRALVD